MAVNDRKIIAVIEKQKEKLKLSWAEVAESCGLAESTLHRIRAATGTWDPKLSTLEAIADGLGLRLRDFFAAR
jgi:transcriptional regulator with XRE-family HTH domain